MLAVLSIANGTDVILLAQVWLVLRVIYLGLYLAGTAYALLCLGWRVGLPDWYGATAALKRLNQPWLDEWRRRIRSLCRLGV